MFPSRYFADRYFAPRYWPPVGATPPIVVVQELKPPARRVAMEHVGAGAMTVVGAGTGRMAIQHVGVGGVRLEQP